MVFAGLVWLAAMGATRLAIGADEPVPGIARDQQKSGMLFQSASTRERQQDLTVNPGMLWVDQGAQLWTKPEGTSQRSCQSCHGEPAAMEGVAARYPVWDAKSGNAKSGDAKAGRMHSIETRIQECRAVRQNGEPLRAESEPLLALSALVSHQSLGKPMSPVIDGPVRQVFDEGRTLYEARVGQLNLSCAQCHEQNWGRRLRSETVSQGHGNGYPLYRLEWQKLGSLHRRLRSCYLSVRSQPPEHGSREHLALELYLAWRAKGLTVETPAVRR